MKRYERIISTIKEETGLLKMIQSGLKPEEIKQAVIESLEPYFVNKDVLAELATEALVGDSINLIRLQKSPWFFRRFEKCLSTYRNAKSRDARSSFECCAAWRSGINESISKFWSVLHLEVDKNTLEIEEFLQECLSNIGDIIEGITKPYLKALLHQMRIAEGVKTAFGHIDSLDLGTTVNELIQESGYPELFMPPPWKIRLNQWRNIAYHSTAGVEDNLIICWYGKSPNIRTVRFPRNELLEAVHTIFHIFKTLKLADSIFFMDNVKEIRKLLPHGDIRPEAEFLNFAAGLASQGFEIVEYVKAPNEARLIVKDISSLNPNERRSHASQFLFPLWLVTGSREVIVEYRERDNTPNVRVSTDSATCQKIYDGELDPLTLAKTMKIVKLKRNNASTPRDGS